MKVKYFLVVVFSLALSAQAQKSLLTLNLEKGKEYKQTMLSQTNMTMTMFGQKVPMEMVMNGTISFLVQSINDTAYEMEVKYEKMSMSMLMQGMQMDYNSENEDDIVSSMLSKMVGRPFEMTMNKQGKVVDVRNIDTIINGLLESLAENPDMTEQGMEQTRQQIMEAYGSDAVKGNMGMSTVIFPEYPVKKGDKWTVQTELISAGMNALVITEYKLAKKSNEYLLIKGKSKIITNDKNTQLVSGIPLGANMNGTMVSEIKTNPLTGWIIRGDTEQKIIMNTSVQESNLEMQMDMTNKMIVTE
jgi:hypothetical protein